MAQRSARRCPPQPYNSAPCHCNHCTRRCSHSHSRPTHCTAYAHFICLRLPLHGPPVRRQQARNCDCVCLLLAIISTMAIYGCHYRRRSSLSRPTSAPWAALDKAEGVRPTCAVTLPLCESTYLKANCSSNSIGRSSSKDDQAQGGSMLPRFGSEMLPVHCLSRPGSSPGRMQRVALRVCWNSHPAALCSPCNLLRHWCCMQTRQAGMYLRSRPCCTCTRYCLHK